MITFLAYLIRCWIAIATQHPQPRSPKSSLQTAIAPHHL